MKNGKVILIVVVSIIVIGLIYYFTQVPNTITGKKFLVNRFVNAENAPNKTWIGINNLQGGFVPYKTFKIGDDIKLQGTKHDGTYEVIDIYSAAGTRDAQLGVKRININGTQQSEGLVERSEGFVIL